MKSQRCSDDIRRGSEFCLPVSIRDQNDRQCLKFFIWKEQSSQDRHNGPHLEEIRREGKSANSFNVAFGFEVQRFSVKACDMTHDGVHVPVVFEVRHCKWNRFAGLVDVLVRNLNNEFRAIERERSEKHSIGNAEDRGVSTYAKCKCDDYNDGERGSPYERPNREP